MSGIPTVTVVTTEFTELALSTMKVNGLSDMSFVTTKHPMGAISLGEIRARAEQDFPQILERAVRREQGRAETVTEEKKAYPSARISFPGTLKDVNDLFLEKGWSLGLPIMPPTTEAVDEMLKGTSHRPDEILWVVPPRMGVLTVELAAVHAVMAGCRPGVLPVILAALEGMSEPEYNWGGAGTTTGSIGPMLLINGPIGKALGIACGQGAAGKGHHPNVSIGYAISLIVYVVGGSRPPDMDKSTFGSPCDDVAWVFSENEDASPWGSYAEEHGFGPADSVVTVKNVYPTVDMPDHSSSTPEEHLKWWRYVLNPLMHVPLCCANAPYFMVLCPEHADLLAQAGWNKDRFRKDIWENTRVPLSVFSTGEEMCGIGPVPEALRPATPDTLIPITLDPKDIEILVAGGTGKHSQYFAPGQGRAVSKLVDPWK